LATSDNAVAIVRLAVSEAHSCSQNEWGRAASQRNRFETCERSLNRVLKWSERCVVRGGRGSRHRERAQLLSLIRHQIGGAVDCVEEERKMKKILASVGALASAALLAFILTTAVETTPAQAALLVPNLKTYVDTTVTPVHCRRNRHCHQRCWGPWWDRRCRRWCHRC
jgi:hypothetical protein